MNLSMRLNAVKDMVIPSDLVCDIGCDHGFVSIALAKEGKAKTVLACDINKGPLSACSEHIKEAGLEGTVIPRLSDGLSKVLPSEAPDAVIIAGMGGALITKILEQGREKLYKVKQLVLSPQSEQFLVRKWLRENGYNIVSEKTMTDLGKFYFIIDARPGRSEKHDEETEEIYDMFSEYLIKTKDSLLREYLQKGLSNNKGYLEGISGDKREVLIQKNQMIEKALSMME